MTHNNAKIILNNTVPHKCMAFLPCVYAYGWLIYLFGPALFRTQCTQMLYLLNSQQQQKEHSFKNIRLKHKK